MHAELHPGNLRRENHLENLDVNGKTKMYDVRVYTECNLFGMRYSGGLF
jgi:hypothetical protein